jgi:hypothetical protein
MTESEWATKMALEEEGSLIGVGPLSSPMLMYQIRVHSLFPDLSFVSRMFIHQIRMRKRLGIAVEDIFAQIHNIHQIYYDSLVKNGSSIDEISKRLNIPAAWDRFWE